MRSISSTWLAAIRSGGGQWYGYCEAWLSGTQLAMPDGSLTLPLQSDGSNDVKVDGSTPGVRRTLSLTLPQQSGLFDALSQTGVTLRPYSAIRYLNGAVESVPQGVFDWDGLSMGYASNGTIQVTGPDWWQRIANAKFLSPRQVGGGGVTAQSVIGTLLLEVLPGSVAVSDISTGSYAVPVQTEDSDRAGLIQSIAKAASLDVYFDRDGGPVIRDVPVLDEAAVVWTCDVGASGVLIGASRTRNKQGVYNMVVVSGGGASGSAPFTPQVVWDADSASPTYAGPGTGAGDVGTAPVASSAGPFGQRPTTYSSSLIGSASQAQAVGNTILGRVRGLNAQLSLTQVPHPGLDDGDTIQANLPSDTRMQTGPIEFHLIDALTHPLVPHRNAQPIATRSTQAGSVS